MSQEMPIVYPVTGSVPPTTNSSNGSYGAVFIVLAVIVTVSAFACFLGRFFNKRQNVSKPSTHSLATKEKDVKRNSNGFHTKDGDIEFGYDKRFASAKVATTNDAIMSGPNSFSEPKMVRPNSFHEPNVGRSDSFHEPTVGQANSFQKANKVPPSSFHEPSMGRPSSFHEPTSGQPNLFHKSNKVQPSSYPEPSMGRPISYHEPSMGQPLSFNKGEYQGDQVRFGDDNRDNQINFKIRTRAQR